MAVSQCVQLLSPSEHAYLHSAATTAAEQDSGMSYEQAILKEAEKQIEALQRDEKAILEVAMAKWKPTQPAEPMAAIFEALLPESPTADNEYARQAMATHPQAARMQYVEEHFYDLLLELEQNGKVDIQC